MGALILFLQAASPTPPPSATAIAINHILSIIASSLAAISGIAANPVMFLVGLGVSLAAAVGIYMFIRSKFKQAAIDAAKKDTEIGYQNQIDNRIPENEKNNEKDNKDRTDLDQIH
jgi:hypothetical protein